MKRRGIATAGLATLVAAPVIARAQTDPANRLVIHVGGATRAEMTLALHNIANFADYHSKRGEPYAVELVANGPGYAMLRADTSPVVAEIAALRAKLPGVVFSACQHSRAGMAAQEGKTISQIPEVPEATDVAAGIARLVELQDFGYRYVRA